MGEFEKKVNIGETGVIGDITDFTADALQMSNADKQNAIRPFLF